MTSTKGTGMLFRSAMLHEAVHALGRMNHRTEPLSIMNEALHERGELSPMDEALLRLHGHELIRPSMTMAEIERLVVFNDELLDPQPPDPRFEAWRLIANAIGKLREATSASFEIRYSPPDCSDTVDWIDYAVGNLTGRHPYFGWVRIGVADSRLYSLQPFPDTFERWRQSPSGWETVDQETFSHATSGWLESLSDPHHMLDSILNYVDWMDAEVILSSDGRTTLRLGLDRVSGPIRSSIEGVEIEMVIDAETYAIHEYRMVWTTRGGTCDEYVVEARNGQYGIEFTLPNAVRQDSDFIDGCEIDQLGLLNGYVRRSGSWARECGLDRAMGGYVRPYRFSIDDWSFVRIELSSYEDVYFELYEGGDSDGSVVDTSASGYLMGGFRFREDQRGRLLWAHTPLAPGNYTLEIVTRNRAFPGVFTFTMTAQRTPPPPYRFKAISVSGGRSCGLLTDGTALCWGSRSVEGDGSIAPEGPFVSIGTGGYTCALREDGTTACWDFNKGGFDQSPPALGKLTSISTGWVHSCGLREDGTPVCWGSNQDGKSSPPAGERFSSIDAGIIHSCGLRFDGSAVCWGGDVNGSLAVPQGERFVAVTAGAKHTCGLRDDGSTLCWGEGAFEQCTSIPGGEIACTILTGDPIPPSPPERERFEALASGTPHCALRADGSPVCWTNDQSGLLPPPQGERFTAISSSADMPALSAWTAPSVCWGADRVGQASPPSGIQPDQQPGGARAPVGLVP